MHPAYERIRQHDALPSIKEVARELLRLANDESASISDVVAIVERDPTIASRLLRLVNSPLYGLSRKTASIRQAVSLLGLQTVASIAIGLSLISQSIEGSCAAFDFRSFWSGSVGTAVAARHLTNRPEHISSDEAFTCGLLCQVGKLAFATVFPQSYAHALHLVDVAGAAGLGEVERGMYELDHNELAAEMMADWNLPAMFCDAVRYQDSPSREKPASDSRMAWLARTLHAAVKIGSVLVGPSVPKEVLTSATVEVNRLGLSPDRFAEAFDSIGREWQAIGPIFGVATREVRPLVEVYSREIQ